MGCQKALDFATTGGAHLSFYWTMDEAGTATKLDSTVGLGWLLAWTTAASPGLFSNGTHCDPSAFQGHGLSLIGSSALNLNATTSSGISVWYWFKLNAYQTSATLIQLDYYAYDTIGPQSTEMVFWWNAVDALTGAIELDHRDSIDPTVFTAASLVPGALGSWHMLAATINTTNQTLNLYFDGVLIGTVADTIPLRTCDTADLELRNLVQAAGNMDVVVDECGISLKGALTQSQITALYNGGAGVTWPNITPIVPYP